MHAKNLFLMDIEHDGATTAEDLAMNAKQQLETWMNDRGDDNNWYTEQLLVLRDGRVLDVTNDDWMTIEQMAELKIRTDNTFDWAHRLAFDIVCTDMDLRGPSLSLIPATDEEKAQVKLLDSMAVGDVQQHIVDTVPIRLSQLYAEVKAGQDDLDSWRRMKLARTFELYWNAAIKPFSTSGTPYNYRAFDLTDGLKLSDIAAILIVDVHT